MTLEQWREQDRLVKWAAETFTTPHGREFLKMLEDSHVRHSVLPFELGDSSPRIALKLGEDSGYSICVNNITASMNVRMQQKPLEATYGTKTRPESK